MTWSRVKAVVVKDMRSVISSRLVLIPIIIVPLLLCIVIPAAIVLLTLSLDTMLISGVQYLEKLIPLYPVPADLPGFSDRVLFIFLNYTFLPFFMLVPIMASSVIATDSIVGEKERKTLETLLYTPLTNRELLTAKLLGAFVPAVLVSWGSFAGYFAVLNLIYYLIRGLLIIRTWIWLPAILLLSPAVSALGLCTSLVVSLKARTYMEAQQMAGIIVLPFVVLVVVQIAGLLIFKPLYVVFLALLLAAGSYLILARIAPRFSRESIINTL